ncbi:GNAT family N-acetyltransferase [Marinactinospora thermotolerans]|uniref:Acetyltransferases n=1 Tax=Marinactinospora thermotolerans DSM 45154 TaxID=1122192 RepID=A0A1T4MGH2_9ACTN|nr:GNAT family N-acetyltransferase [Marinactinospora thermotolerans]SJZ65967.1 Acetyltransferases [Marinactinospora thermotolerans DSM 45154]
MDTQTEIWDLAAPAFVRAIPALAEIYSAAMRPEPDLLPGRRAIMHHHADLPSFHSVVAVKADTDEAVGFAYGFHGRAGQWWHDVVTRELTAHDPAAVPRWFGDSFEIAEVHVRPESQGRGLGRALLERLTSGRTERTAALSTPVGPSRARRLYLSCGFVDVLDSLRFPGSPDQPFAIMAATLPLREPASRRSSGRSPGSRSTGSA